MQSDWQSNYREISRTDSAVVYSGACGGSMRKVEHDKKNERKGSVRSHGDLADRKHQSAQFYSGSILKGSL